ncbi:MAG: DNA methyltransferase [Phycisphaerae bacterium SM23_30]|nr:MAG: DNA methyltransferase [Phycisphaerae bacterium SM23_30]
MGKYLFKELEVSLRASEPPKRQLLKWIGNKHRFAQEIVSYFPSDFNTYYEPFLGSGAVLATLAWEKSVGSDIFLPLIDIWQTLAKAPDMIKKWYLQRWKAYCTENRKEGYEKIKASYNKNPNGADLLFLCRSCYGGVVRFRKMDGYMSTPCGIHEPISPEAFSKRVDEWYVRVKRAEFVHLDYQQAMGRAQPGDLIYCDPPYKDTQPILYGAQSFSIKRLFEVVAECKKKGIYVALSIDGSKRSGKIECNLPIPKGLFEREAFVNCGRSMLKRFQMNGRTLEKEVVHDRLLLTY